MALMPPWIRVEGDINKAYKPILVWSSEEATRLSEHDGQQVTRSATDEYPDYAWRHVPIMGFPDFYIVEGSQKKRRK